MMQNLGIRRGPVVYGTDRLDEISASAPTAVCEIRDGKTNLYEITPEQFGYTRCQKSDLLGGTPEENAQITRNILSGEDRAEASGRMPQRRCRSVCGRQRRNRGGRRPACGIPH